MRNRIQKMQDEMSALVDTINELNNKRPRTRYEDIRLSSCITKAKTLKNQMIHFGTEIPMVKVEIHFRPLREIHRGVEVYGDLKKEYFYLTDADETEATMYAKFRYSTAKIETLKTLKVPLGSPYPIK